MPALPSSLLSSFSPGPALSVPRSAGGLSGSRPVRTSTRPQNHAAPAPAASRRLATDPYPGVATSAPIPGRDRRRRQNSARFSHRRPAGPPTLRTETSNGFSLALNHHRRQEQRVPRLWPLPDAFESVLGNHFARTASGSDRCHSSWCDDCESSLSSVGRRRHPDPS